MLPTTPLRGLFRAARTRTLRLGEPSVSPWDTDRSAFRRLMPWPWEPQAPHSGALPSVAKSPKATYPTLGSCTPYAPAPAAGTYLRGYSARALRGHPQAPELGTPLRCLNGLVAHRNIYRTGRVGGICQALGERHLQELTQRLGHLPTGDGVWFSVSVRKTRIQVCCSAQTRRRVPEQMLCTE